MKDCDDTFIKLDGIMVRQDFNTTIMSAPDVTKYTPMQSFSLKQHLHVPFEHDV